MATDNIYNIDDYRRSRVSKPKVVDLKSGRVLSRRPARVNLAELFTEELDPEIRLQAHMAMIKYRIDGLKNDPVRRFRVTETAVWLQGQILEARQQPRETLIRFLTETTEKEWLAAPNRYLAIIERVKKLTPPTTNP
jgi:hypothetical protein